MIVNVLRQHPQARGVVYDMPHVVVEAQRRLEAEGLSDRARVEGGSFFDGVPAGGDLYILSHIIHDWDEARCVGILNHCREAKAAGGKVLIVEMVVPPPNVPHPAKMLDIVMLAVPGGQERTEDEYRELLAKAGLRLTRVRPDRQPGQRDRGGVIVQRHWADQARRQRPDQLHALRLEAFAVAQVQQPVVGQRAPGHVVHGRVADADRDRVAAGADQAGHVQAEWRAPDRAGALAVDGDDGGIADRRVEPGPHPGPLVGRLQRLPRPKSSATLAPRGIAAISTVVS